MAVEDGQFLRDRAERFRDLARELGEFRQMEVENMARSVDELWLFLGGSST